MALGISMIMLTSDAPIRAAGIQSQLAEHWSDLPAATVIDEEQEVVSLDVGEATLILAPMPGPIPWSDLEGPCATSILWRDAAAEVQRHTSHWIVTVNADVNPFELSTLLTQATAAALAVCPAAIGVFWGNAALVVPKNIFIDFARKILPEGPPLYIWVDFRVGKDSEHTCSGFTAGMKALGHMEFETEQCPEPPGELRERLMALAGYVLENGPVIRNGDTFGEDADERIRVVHADSAFGHADQVMRLEYESESAKKPWWKLW